MGSLIYHYYYKLPRRKKEEEEFWRKNKEEAARKNKEEILNRLNEDAFETFCVELDTINEKGAQDEIVRIVNLLAHETSEACMNQDKFGRREKVRPYLNPGNDDTLFPDYIPWSTVADRLKISWSKTRNLALQIAPELADRMPHFSQVEPLKSYNEEHLLQKKTNSVSQLAK